MFCCSKFLKVDGISVSSWALKTWSDFWTSIMVEFQLKFKTKTIQKHLSVLKELQQWCSVNKSQN